MVIYPFLLQLFGLSPIQSDIFLGGTIHDVTQVVAAGMMMGQDAGGAATVAKLFRVVLLMPVVLQIAFAYRKHGAVATTAGIGRHKVPLVPTFLIGFVVLVLIASTGMVPEALVSAVNGVSRWWLVIAILAAGVKTSFEDLKKLGWQPCGDADDRDRSDCRFCAACHFASETGPSVTGLLQSGSHTRIICLC